MAAYFSASDIATISLSLMTVGVIGDAGRDAGTSSVVGGVSGDANMLQLYLYVSGIGTMKTMKNSG
jgi:hypothetical protein